MKFHILLIFLFVISGCGGIPLSADTTRQAAEVLACGALDAAGCLDDEAVQAAFPGVDAGTCTKRAELLFDLVSGSTTVVDASKIVIEKIDLSKVDIEKLSKLTSARCSTAEKALGL